MITREFDPQVITPALFVENDSSNPSGSRQQESERIKSNTKAKRILVVDDEANIANSLAKILTGKGYSASAFYSGQAAIESAREQCPDLVISDVIMPRVDGIETALAIREFCPKTRVILFSGQAGTMDLLEKARCEGHTFELIPKPMHPDALLKKLSQLFA